MVGVVVVMISMATVCDASVCYAVIGGGLGDEVVDDDATRWFVLLCASR